MQYNPKLKTAMEQIKEILKNHDIAGFVVLADGKGYSEFLNHVTPSFSCAKIEDTELRFRIKSAEVGKEKARELAECTVNFIRHFATEIDKHAMLYIDADEMLKKKFGTENLPGGGETSHDQQNN